MSLHIELADALHVAFGAHLSATHQKQDALIVQLDNGTELTVRYPAPDAYSLRWTFQGAELGIDTAPLHEGLKTFPNHLHQADGRVVADPVTKSESTPAENLTRLVAALLKDPLLGHRPPVAAP
ncbi:MAG TPA: hypothetical protein VJ673_19070 [Aromatoleum sp.]|uniref:hypothetical protein n=1 Tax=Aromatoleum sp. TaxID=2307007 RepID=UPI002B492F3E|nr:hypothetical protein [Aromatoleum sp.]HJV27791.1 hypothetical protein [Aromatoleum sp.]